MSFSSRTTASQKQSICKKLITILKKEYKRTVPKGNRPVLETMLYAICLENASIEDADAAFQRLHTRFHDLNEIRVSSIAELEAAFEGLDHPEWRALRARSTLQYVFEKYFAFDFESLRRKTLEQATKQLRSIDTLTPFVRNCTLQGVLGCHIVPVDDAMRNAVIWLGLVAPDLDSEVAGETLKSIIRKADVPMYCYLLRSFATDPKVRGAFASFSGAVAKEGFDPATAPERLTDLLKRGFQKPKRAKGKRSPAAAKKKSKTKKSPSGTASPRKTSATKQSTNSRNKATRTGAKKVSRKRSGLNSQRKTTRTGSHR